MTRHNQGATSDKSSRQDPSQGQYPCSCRADYTRLLCGIRLGLQSRRDGARGMGSSSGFRRFGNVEFGLRLSGLNLFDTENTEVRYLFFFSKNPRYWAGPPNTGNVFDYLREHPQRNWIVLVAGSHTDVRVQCSICADRLRYSGKTQSHHLSIGTVCSRNVFLDIELACF